MILSFRQKGVYIFVLQSKKQLKKHYGYKKVYQSV